MDEAKECAQPKRKLRFLKLRSQIGAESVHQLAASMDPESAEATLRDLLHTVGAAKTRGRLAPPTVALGSAGTPWARGYNAAKALRAELGLSEGPLQNERLAELLGLRTRHLMDPALAANLPASVVARDGSEQVTYVFRKRFPTSRRFEASRWIGQALLSRDAGWLTSTDASTAQQKYQRAFAAEFLMPLEELKERVRAGVDDETLEEIAEDYQVSSQTVHHHLVNHGVIPRTHSLETHAW